MPDTTKGLTPSQTVGPFFKYGLTPEAKYDWNDAFTSNLVTPDTSGERIRVQGRVFDGGGQPITDGMLEIWQADAQGHFADPEDKRALPNSAFTGFGRCGTDPNGDYAFDTINRARYPIPMANRRRHISCSRCSRAASCCISTRGFISAARQPMIPIPCWRWCPPTAATL
jgi:protocatechuate 3,4-dioxygenase alpha subunit